MKTIDFSHFIERYIAGEMREDERTWFEKELNGNGNLRAELELRRKTDDILRNKDIMNLRNKLSTIEKQKKEAAVAAKELPKRNHYRYAAIVTALVLIGSIAVLTGRKSGSDELLGKYYRTYEPMTSQRSGHTVSNADFTLALEFYNTNDFTNAALFFSKVLEKNPIDMQSVLLYGVSNFEDKKYPEAESSFTTVIDDNNNLFIETARWYLALCYIRTKDDEKAREQLQVIADEGGIYSKNARKILRNIK
jgi:tetratricopeptide (TPR) repeat protein